MTPPRLDVAVHRDGRAALTPDTCPTCARTITGLRPPPAPLPGENLDATRIPPAQWFTVEPCGHEVALFLTIEPLI